MRKQLTVQQLCRKYRIDTPHADHVEGVALELFKHARTPCGMRHDDRNLLEAACRLHDVAPATETSDHARRGAEIVQREGLGGFTQTERGIVAAAISMHALKDPVRPSLPVPLCWNDIERAMRLAAIVRIADSLDHGHLQGTTVDRVSLTGKGLKLRTTVSCPPDNTARARQRADLWQRVFPVPLSIRTHDCIDREHLFKGVVRENDSIIDAARRILGSQYVVMRSNLHAMQEHLDPDYLHDFRVAMRRFRCALRVFAPQLRGTGAARQARSLARLSAALGPIRDSQAWMEFLRSPGVVAACSGDPLWEAYVEDRRRHMLRHWRRLQTMCRQPEFESAIAGMREMLRSALPSRLDKRGRRPFHGFAQKKLWETYTQLASLSGNVHAMESDELHTRRKRYRRGRYLAEFALPLLDGDAAYLHRTLKRQASQLGTVHDVDVHLLTAPAHATGLPEQLQAHAVSLRNASLDRFVSEQKQLTSKKFRGRMRSLLSTD